MKRILAITLLALTVGLNAPPALAQGTAESPGVHVTTTTTTTTTSQSFSVSGEGTAESPGYIGTAESPGFAATFLIYLGVII